MFNLSRERIPYYLVGSQLFYISNKNLKHYNCETKQDIVLKKFDTGDRSQGLLYNVVRSMSVLIDGNKTSVLIMTDHVERSQHKYEIHQFEGDICQNRFKDLKSEERKFGYAVGAVFLQRGKLAKLQSDNVVLTMDYETNIIQKSLENIPLTEAIFQGPAGKLILKSEDQIILYDLVTKKQINSYNGLESGNLKQVIWSPNNQYVALVCKKSIIVMNKNFNKVCNVDDRFNVKSLIWNVDNVIIYNTINHIKYALLNGDTGILKCMDYPCYLFKMDQNNLILLNKDAEICEQKVIKDEYLFKLALYNKNPKQINYILNNHQRLGNSLISYLYKNNYPQIALNLVQDPRAKFSLAIDSGNLEVAYAMAKQLKDINCYQQLGEEALRQGNHQLLEIAYQYQKSFEKLTFLYMATGNTKKLEKLLLIAQNRNDYQSRFNNALFLGDVSERIRILAEIGQLPLAYLMSILYNQQEMAIPLKQSILENIQDLDMDFSGVALVPPKPLIPDLDQSQQAKSNWPNNQIQEEEILALHDPEQHDHKDQNNPDEVFVDDIVSQQFESVQVLSQQQQQQQNQEENTNAWGNDSEDDLDLPDDTPQTSQQTQSVSIVGLEIQPGLEQTVEQNRNSPFAGIQVAIGNFENALQLLKKQIGLVNPKPYKNIFTDAFMTASLQISSVPFTKAFDLRLPLLQLQSTPALLENELKQAYKLVSDYKLQEATEKFNQILLLIPLQVLNNQGEVQNSIKLIRICLEYIVALKCEILKSNYANDQVRCLELSAYMSMCQVQPIHRILFLKNVMGQAYKLKDYIYASYFAKKIVQLGELHPQAAKEETTSKAKKVYQACEQQGTNQHKINFDEKLLSDTDAVLKLCSKTLEIIKNRDVKKCPYCSATYNQQFDGITCQICQISKVGVEVMGLKIQNQ